MRRLDRDRTRGVPGKDRGHRLPQRLNVSHLDANLVEDRPCVHLTIAERGPGDVVKEEVGPRRIRRTAPATPVDLNVLEVGHFLQQPQALTGTPQLTRARRGGRQPRRRDLFHPIDDLSRQPQPFAVAGVPNVPPGLLDRAEPRGDVARRRVDEPLDRLRRGAGDHQVGGDVVATEQVFQDIDVALEIILLWRKVLVRVGQRRLLDMVDEFTHGCIPPSLRKPSRQITRREHTSDDSLHAR
jgi:hypothetical protein